MELEIKQIKNIIKKGDRVNKWSINFTDGSYLIVKNVDFPFRPLTSQGMLVEFFFVNRTKKALFGWPEKDNSIALKDCYEWSKEHSFDQLNTYWRSYFQFAIITKVVDNRKPGKSIFLKVNKEGDIISP